MRRPALALSFAVIAATSPARAAHPALEACGGVAASRDDGVLDDRAVPKKLEARVDAFLKEADITPGLAVTIVKGDRIVYARGFGFRDLAACAPVTTDTRFYLKSTTKSFLGIAAASLHEKGAIDLDAPISDYLPGLVPPEGINPAQISLRAHFTHTQPYFDAGLNWRTANAGNLPEAEYVAHANAFSEAKDIKFRYSNFGPIMGAHAIGAKTGKSWRELLASEVFAPAGMRSTFASVAGAEEGEVATSYLGAGGDDFTPTPTKVDSQMHAAGGAYSTAADLGRFLIVNLDGGRIDGAQAIPARAVVQAQARQAQLDWTYYEFRRFATGLGVYSADYEGDVLMHHFGGETHLSFMPGHDIGVAVLANEIADGDLVTHRLAATIYDILLGKDDIDARLARRLEEIRSARATRIDGRARYVAEQKAQAPAGEPRYRPEQLAARYVDPRLGEIVIAEDRGALSMRFGELSAPLAPVGGDGYLADFQTWGDPPVLFVFRTDDKGRRVLDWGGRIFVRR